MSKKVSKDEALKAVKTITDEISKSSLEKEALEACLLYTSPSPRDTLLSRMPSSA